MASVFEIVVGIGEVMACGTPAPMTQAPTTSSNSARNIKHHDNEQKQHGDRADVDHDQNHREELGAHHHEQAGRVHECKNEIKNGMHGIARRNHHDRAGHANTGEKIKEQRGHDHAPISAISFVMPGLVPGIHVLLARFQVKRGWPAQARP